jgi:hypothetical protein
MEHGMRHVISTGLYQSVSLLAGCIAILGFANPASAVPALLTGKLVVEPADGSVAGDVCLGRLPDGVTGFVLNRGLNVREVRDGAAGSPLAFEIDPERPADDDAGFFRLTAKGLKELCISYVGRFPVFRVDKGERAADDWKGRIAFDGKTVRAADQSRFVPSLIAGPGVEKAQMAYDIEVECASCRTLFWNGSHPVAGPSARFTSAAPRSLMLYAGDIDFSVQPKADFVGAAVTPSVAAAVSTGLKRIAEAHEAYIGVPYTDQPSLMSFASVGRDRKIDSTSWQFVVWPTVAADGRLQFERYLAGRQPDKGLSPGIERYLAHEMAHYYFGTRFVASGPLKWFLTESTAEFLSMKAVRQLQGPAAYAAIVAEHAATVANKTVMPLDRVTGSEQIGEGYRYKLGPLLLIGMEKRLGAETVRRMLSELVTEAPETDVGYADLQTRLRQAGATQGQLAAFAAACLVESVPATCWE